MTIQTTTLTSIRTLSMAGLDDITHIGFSTDTSAENEGNTSLTSEIIRKALESSNKDTGTGEYSFEGYLGLTEGNTNTLARSGLFTASTGGTMRSESLWTNTVSKSATVDLSVGIKVTFEVVNV